MKNIRLYSVLLVAFLLFNSSDLFAQKHHKDREKARKEYYKKQEKNRKHYQKKAKKSVHYSYSKPKKRNGPPSWAPAHGYRAKNHVYFRDYYTFYDPYRGGYVYRNKNKWIFSRTVPTFLVGVNLNNARVQLLTDIPLNRHPEQYYSRYSSRYPRDSRINVNISF